MAKQISQQTFDDVVRENMQEFEMEAEEALEDAVQQFHSQVAQPLYTEITGAFCDSGHSLFQESLLAALA